MVSRVFSNSIPNQVVDKVRKKNDKLAIATVDVLESIAMKQLRDNKVLEDYYKMLDGKLVWADYSDEDLNTLDTIKGLIADDVNIPSFVKHYDLIGIIVNQLVGEWLESQDDYNIDCTDNYTENEFLRERKRRLEQFVMERFQVEVMRVMAEQGFNEQTEFESEEEQQAYLQQIEEIKNSIKTPEQIEKDMRTWKTEAVSWANSVIENDAIRFRMESLIRTEMTDYCLTGRYFRNYYIGYDFYKPERWNPVQVFFSREDDAIKPQDREYVGRQFRAPIYKIRERYGHKISPKDLANLDTFYGQFVDFTKEESLDSVRGLNRALFGENVQVPFYNYFEHEDAIETQDLFGIPMGRNIVNTDEGEVEVPYFLGNGVNYHGRYGEIDRTDFQVRTDTVLVTEGYYRSYKKVYIAVYEDENGIRQTDMFTNELLPEFIKEKGLVRDNKTSLEDAMEELKANTLYTFHQPVIREFIKINSGNIGQQKGVIYYDEELPYQIKGNSDLLVDVIIPVAGIIDSNFIANKIRPYQIGYNISLNQVMNMMEKELGLFFLFDINLLPSEYKLYGDTEEALVKLNDFIRDTGFAPIDSSKQNTGYNSPMGNSFSAQEISYTNQINSRIQLAEHYKRLAIEQIGITPHRLGNPNQYETAEGIRQGVEASYAQTENMFSKMSQAHLDGMEVHLSVAQYCQKNYKDADFVFTKTDGTRGFVHLSDEGFPLRRFGVMPVNNSKNKFQRQNLINTLLNLNTLGGDVLDYAQIYTANSTQEIVEIGRKARIEKQRENEAQRQHEQELADKQLQATAEKEERERQFKAEENQKDREADIVKAQLNALGRASYSETISDDENINQIAESRLKQMQIETDINYKNSKLEMEQDVNERRLTNERERMELEKQKLEQRKEDNRVKQEIAYANKN